MRRAMTGGAVAAAALLMVSGASAQEAESTLVIDGTSTVRSWSCEADGYTVAPRPATGFEAKVLKGEAGLETVTVTFPIAAIDCGNGTMNGHLQKALKAESHPTITYALSRYQIESAAAGMVVKADGQLTIAGETRPVQMAVTVSPDGQGGLRVRGEQEIVMSEFGVKPPTLMLGTLKVGDAVKVKFDVPLRSQGAVMGVGSDH